jgi:hypothetical protein
MRHSKSYKVTANIFFVENKRTLQKFFCAAILLSLFFATGCQTVKPYQRAYLNDDNMQAGKQPIKTYSGHVHTYREGAAGGGRGKSSGGCGCN